ncbi:MAG: bifunctional [glutamate--ammonia ligase]-adenylyl-L-tyrosine phosphorylase/[glutamate--ammonia-ligase] adenylyltransferase, partial [Aquificaceae bacterium]|nr:bifunctional [glutamate--ammonia ligase]-adenylyl-L-tyrosine phosphorylase/[glutamate--ammonia-ligase] adenylyltransferase [Aquificaceae bacterium]
MIATFPVDWWKKAEEKVFNLQKARESLEELLKKHPDPQSLIDYLNERRFVLLLELLDQSECIRKFLINHPEDFQRTIPGLWYVFKDRETYLKELRDLLPDSISDEEFSKRLAYYRHRELMRIVSKEILGTAKLQDLLHEYSQLPDAMLQVCYDRALAEFVDKYGKPTDEEGKPATGCIIALGKLGSYELNYYSDIDIMFIHSSDKGYAGRLTLNEFFSGLFQKVFRLMTQVTSEGKPYEVDLDLRPFGKSGPISMSLRSAELYYESYGRTWERFALLRARYCAGDEELYRAFDKEVKEPFVFRKSIDYRVLDEIRLIKAQIASEAKKRLLNKQNVKTGEGGIREVEFTVQALVLILGGKFPFLRESNTFRAIWKLNQKGVFSNEEALFLERAYEFLRKLEHKIQTYACMQTQSFSHSDIKRLAKVINMDEKTFVESYKNYTQGVSGIFSSIMPSQEEDLHPLQRVFLNQDAEEAVEMLKSLGFKSPVRAYNILSSYITGREGIKLSTQEKQAFIRLLPKIIETMTQTTDPDETLSNFDKFFSNPTGRKVVLSPAKEDVNKNLCRIFSLSSYLSTLISRYPDLVEDVLTLYQDFPTLEEFEEEFEKYKETLNLSQEDLYRRFKKVWEIRIALVYLLKKDDRYKKLFDFFQSLSDLSDFLLKKLWKDLGVDSMILVALGKYGSKELTVGSDLDLVFVSEETGQEKTKKAQELIVFLTKHTSEGYLYKVDFRLRPMGSVGEIAPSIDFYREYFQNHARTWERLAWTRCRYIIGKTELQEEFEHLLRSFLFEKPLGEIERREIRDMRFALESNARKRKGFLDIKFSAGGLIDAEFIIQYYTLLERLREPSMTRACEKLMQTHPLLREVYDNYLFLRLVETRLRLSKESAGSVLSLQEINKVANSLGISAEELEEKIKGSMKRLREIFLE